MLWADTLDSLASSAKVLRRRLRANTNRSEVNNILKLPVPESYSVALPQLDDYIRSKIVIVGPLTVVADVGARIAQTWQIKRDALQPLIDILPIHLYGKRELCLDAIFVPFVEKAPGRYVFEFASIEQFVVRHECELTVAFDEAGHRGALRVLRTHLSLKVCDATGGTDGRDGMGAVRMDHPQDIVSGCAGPLAW